jgi:hypothetical protein
VCLFRLVPGSLIELISASSFSHLYSIEESEHINCLRWSWVLEPPVSVTTLVGLRISRHGKQQNEQYAEWKPGAPDSVPLNLNGPGTLQVGHERAAILVCYEQLLVWPVLTSMTERPTVLVGLANDYWAKDTIIPAIQHSCLEAWARLFDIPLVKAVNF